jgi:DNA polymerase-3 subunit delta'
MSETAVPASAGGDEAFARLCGQPLAKGILAGALRAGRLAHAYLFAGPDGSGKSVAASDLAAAVLGAPPEGHPDHHVFAPERQRFLIDQVREICRRAALAPYAAPRSVFVLKRAEALTGEAAAALLKLIEEPPGPALFVLLCEHAAQVEATLRSRCQVVPFGAVPPGELSAWLSAQGIEDAAELAGMSMGNPGLALRMAADDAWRRRRERAERLLAEVGTGDAEDELQRAAEAADDDQLLAALVPALRSGLAEGGSLDALDAWFEAEAALAANVTRRLTWEVLLLRLRRAKGVRYDAGSR